MEKNKKDKNKREENRETITKTRTTPSWRRIRKIKTRGRRTGKQ